MQSTHANAVRRAGGRVHAVAARAVADYRADHGPQLAAAVSFHVLFSLFPLAILLVAVFGLILRDPSVRDEVVAFLLRKAPLSSEGRAEIEDLLGAVASGRGALGFLGLVGLAWSASGMMAALRAAMNAAWKIERGRPFVRGKLLDVALIGGLGLLFLVSLGLTAVGRIVDGLGERARPALGPLASTTAVAIVVLGIVVAFAVSFLVVALVYRVVPAARPPLRDVWAGAAVAAVGFELVKNAFALYLAHFGDYDAVYGTLGAVVALLFFVYLAANAVLFGAEVSAACGRERRARGAVSSPMRAVPGAPPQRPRARP